MILHPATNQATALFLLIGVTCIAGGSAPPNTHASGPPASFSASSSSSPPAFPSPLDRPNEDAALHRNSAQIMRFLASCTDKGKFEEDSSDDDVSKKLPTMPDFVSPLIRTGSVIAKGGIRGVLAVSDIQPGELLVSAFSAAKTL